MVITATVATVRAHVALRMIGSWKESHSEIIGFGIDRRAHVGDSPSARRLERGAEDVEPAQSRMAVR